MTDRRAGDNKSEGMDRIGGIGYQHHVARRCDRLRKIGETFLRTQRGDDFGLRIDLHAKAARVIGAHRPPQTLYAARCAIAIGARVARRLDQFLHDMLWRRHVGIAHAEIDDVLTARACLGLQPIDLLEDVGRKPADAVEIGLHD